MAEETETPDGKIPMPVANFKVDANPGSRVKKMIGVVSGKGGVGKSSVTGLCALWSLRHGYRTGIMDCDITGPSIPRMFGVTSDDIGVEGVRPDGEGGTLIPAETSTGIKVMSMNLLMQNEEQPVVWRGPIVAGVVKQFWTDVKWGDVDYMFGESHADEVAKAENTVLIDSLPIDPKMAQAMDGGTMEFYETQALEKLSEVLPKLD